MKCYRMSTHRACRKILDRILIFFGNFQNKFSKFQQKNVVFFGFVNIFFENLQINFQNFIFSKFSKFQQKNRTFQLEIKVAQHFFQKKS